MKQREKRRTSNWNIVITILHCCAVNVKRIHVHRTLVVVVYVAVGVRLALVLLRFLDVTVTVAVLHLKELKLARDCSTIIAFTATKVFLLTIFGPGIMQLRTRYRIERHPEARAKV